MMSVHAIEIAISELQKVRDEMCSASPFDQWRLRSLCRAIAFQRQVELGYGGTIRTVEPYLLREAGNGRLLLYAHRAGSCEAEDQGPSLRSYRVDRIESVDVTGREFAR